MLAWQKAISQNGAVDKQPKQPATGDSLAFPSRVILAVISLSATTLGRWPATLPLNEADEVDEGIELSENLRSKAARVRPQLLYGKTQKGKVIIPCRYASKLKKSKLSAG